MDHRVKNIIFLFLVSSALWSAEKAIKIEMINTPLKEIINELEQQSEHLFIYNEYVNDKTVYSVSSENETLKEVLEKLFSSSTVQFKIRSPHVILKSINEPTSETTIQRQKLGTLSGYVKDAESGETLIGATIIGPSGSYVLTNNFGFYSFEVPEGINQFTLSHIGYGTIVETIKVEGKTTHYFNLTFKATSLSEVEVSSDSYKKERTRTLQNVIQFNRQDLIRFPALLGVPDINRIMKSQAGVSSVGEGTSGFNVRGGNIDQNLILLDGAPFYNSSHLFGLFSIFNTASIKDLKLYTGGIPARFGGRASSVLDIRLRDGNTQKFAAEGSIGPIVTHLQLETPLVKDKSAILISGRRSFIDLFQDLSNSTNEEKVYFYDFTAKTHYRINPKNTVYLSGFFGADNLNFEIDETKKNGPKKEKTKFNWNQSSVSFKWNRIFNGKLFMNLSSVFSQYDYGLSSDSSDNPIIDLSGDFNWNARIRTFETKTNLTYNLNPENTFKGGGSVTKHSFSPTKIEAASKYSQNISLETENAVEIGLFGEWETQWKRFQINTGLRWSQFSNIGPGDVYQYAPGSKSLATIVSSKTYEKNDVIKAFNNFEPRIALKYKWSEDLALKANYNRMYQYIHLISNTLGVVPYDIWKPSGTYIEPLKVDQFAIGFALNKVKDKKRIDVGIEAYYKSFNNLIEYKDGANLIANKYIETEFIPAKGISYGLEISADYVLNQWFGNFNYTYSRSERKTDSNLDEINQGEYYPSNFDRPHVLNVNTSRKLGSRWEATASFTFRSGRPITIPTGSYDLLQGRHFNFSERNEYRISPIHRLDLSFNLYPKERNKRWKSHWTFGVYNVYARKNPLSVIPSTTSDKRTSTYEFSLLGAAIPFVSYQFKF